MAYFSQRYEMREEEPKKEIIIADVVPIIYRTFSGNLFHGTILTSKRGKATFIESGSNGGRLNLWNFPGKDNGLPQLLAVDGEYRLDAVTRKIVAIYLFNGDIQVAKQDSLEKILKNPHVFLKSTHPQQKFSKAE